MSTGSEGEETSVDMVNFSDEMKLDIQIRIHPAVLGYWFGQTRLQH